MLNTTPIHKTFNHQNINTLLTEILLITFLTFFISNSTPLNYKPNPSKQHFKDPEATNQTIVNKTFK